MFHQSSDIRRNLHSFPTRRSSDLVLIVVLDDEDQLAGHGLTGSVKVKVDPRPGSLPTQIRPPCSSTNFMGAGSGSGARSEEHTSELQSQFHLVCRLLLEKKNNILQ